MWVFENEGDALGGKRLWLRPGKRYLFGRTVAEPGQLAIRGPGADKVSRKHVTIEIGAVPEGEAATLTRRSRVTVEDLGSKGGTKVNDKKYKGESCILSQDSNTLQMGSFPTKFRITWFPVVLSFSFTPNQLKADPLTRLRRDLEQLDVKLLTDYDVDQTTHVVSKKRNTSKGLQALINARYIVNDAFVEAVVTATTAEELSDGVATSPLETDFDAYWPDALRFLPPPGEEPVPRPADLFVPDPARAELFDGYTFIFYDHKQYESLLAPITNGKGKALFHKVVAQETQVDEFVGFVKEIAGEKGLGEFEDGSEGRGVVVVKWMPASLENVDWYAEFFRSISLRLDHRLVDQKDFLDAILSNDASGLRRPLEYETELHSSPEGPAPSAMQDHMEVDSSEPALTTQRPAQRRRAGGPVKSRFKGFAVPLNSDNEDETSTHSQLASTPVIEPSQEGLFVSQDVALPEEPDEAIHAGRQTLRKRPAPSPPPEDLMEGFAPNAAHVKRRRIETGEDPIPRQKAEPARPAATGSEDPKTIMKSNAKKEIDILDVARQHREAAERRAKEEREDLQANPEDLDLAEIRRLQIEKPMALRVAPPQRTREQDVTEGRWDPTWNGRKNFKKFRQRDAIQGRAPEKIIVQLEEVKSKGFGIGDDYWLDDGSQQRKKKQSQNRSQSITSANERAQESQGRKRKRIGGNLLPLTNGSEDGDIVNVDNDPYSNDDLEDLVTTSKTKTRAGKAAPAKTTQSQSTRSGVSQGTTNRTIEASSSRDTTAKRPAPAPPAKEKPAKRSRVISIAASDDDSDDGLRFRFGKR